MEKNLKIISLGQVFSTEKIVVKMLNLIQNNGTILEPSAGDGAFYNQLINKYVNVTAIEIDETLKQDGYTIMDFFDLDINNKYDTIIGNPPYVKFKHIIKTTKNKLNKKLFDNRTNLYIFFIEKCLSHLTSSGELIFITPRDFIKGTSAIKLNNLIYETGTITHYYEIGDEKIFKKHSPNVAIWRFKKNDFSRKTITNNGIKNFININGQLSFQDTNENTVAFSDLFFVKVGAVSGDDKLYTSENGNMDFVCSNTNKTGKLKRMYYNIINDYILSKKDILIKRKIKKFTENNWWMWGRDYYKSDNPRIYVNSKTRNIKPFFTNECHNYDGSILAIFIKDHKNFKNLNELCVLLNNVDWDELGFKVGNRYVFAQKSLENCYIPSIFKKYI